MFKERKKFALLSLLSALVVVSTAFVGISIYAETDDSEVTTFEEEAMAAGEDFENLGTDNATSDDAGNATEDTTIAEIMSLFDGLVLCDLGTTEVSGETQTAAFDNASLTTPTVSVEVMTETEVAELASNETSTASADNETSIASTACVLMGEGNSTSTAANGNATDGANATSTASSNATLTADNATSLDSLDMSNETSTAGAPESDSQILVIEGQDFVPGQAVLIFSEDVLVGIDEVAEDGSIETKVPMPDGGETATAGNDTSTELRFVETGTQRTATFDFDGETLTAVEGGDIEVEDGGDELTTTPAPSDNETSTNDTSTAGSSNSTPQY